MELTSSETEFVQWRLRPRLDRTSCGRLLSRICCCTGGFDAGDLKLKALIFDFDGVIADSEALGNTVLAEFVTTLGHPTNLDQALERYAGRRWDDVIAAIEAYTGRPVSPGFTDELKSATFDRFRTDLREVSGASGFIEKFSGVPRCIASSSSME